MVPAVSNNRLLTVYPRKSSVITDKNFSIRDVLPHAGPMVLLDEILHFDENSIETLVTIRKTSMFIESNGQVPCYVSLEYMAQSIAAYAGIKEIKVNKPVKIGLLLGTRRLDFSSGGFSINQCLRIQAQSVWSDNEIGAFDCNIWDFHSKKSLAKGTINVVQPDKFDRDKTL